MAEMNKYTKRVSNTYFKKLKAISIDEVKPGELVYLSVKSPLHYGNYSWEFWGKIQKLTPQFFDIIEYCEAHFCGPNDCRTETITQKEMIPECCKRWAKKSILELYLATATEIVEEVTYYSTRPVTGDR